MKTENIEQRSPEWFKARKGKITGSQVGAILGVNPYKKPADAMREMVRSFHNAPSEFSGNTATEWGTANEASATQQFEMFHSIAPVIETGFHIHPEHDWLGASPDGLLDENGVIEIKCPYGQREKNPPTFKTLAEQPHYQAQIQIELFCTGREFCEFYQWAPFGDLKETEQFNQLWIDENLPKLKAFHDAYLVERELPNAQRYLEPKHTEVSDTFVIDLVTRHSELSEQIKALEVLKKDLFAEIVERCGEKESEINGHKLTLVERKGSIDYKKVPELKGVDLESYRKAGSSYWKLS